MTARQLPAWLEEKTDRATEQAKPSSCRRCGAPVIVARAGRIAALDVVADPEPLPPAAELLALLDGRLTWHLAGTPTAGQRLTWRDQFHIRAGPAKWPVLADHRCPTRKGSR